MLLHWQAGEKAVSCGVRDSGKIEELQVVKDLHKTYSSLGYFLLKIWSVCFYGICLKFACQYL